MKNSADFKISPNFKSGFRLKKSSYDYVIPEVKCHACKNIAVFPILKSYCENNKIFSDFTSAQETPVVHWAEVKFITL